MASSPNSTVAPKTLPERLRIYVACDRISQRGPLYTARLRAPDGDILVTGTMEPALAAARALISKGYDPAIRLEMWDADRPYAQLTGVLGVMAKQTVIENEKIGPRFGKYVPFQSAVSWLSGKAKTGVQPVSATEGGLDAPASVRTACDSDADLSDELRS